MFRQQQDAAFLCKVSINKAELYWLVGADELDWLLGTDELYIGATVRTDKETVFF